MRKFTGKMPEPRTVTQTLCGPAAACVVEMHLDISQEPLCAEIYRKNARAQNHDADFVQARAQSKCSCGPFTRATLRGNL